MENEIKSFTSEIGNALLSLDIKRVDELLNIEQYSLISNERKMQILFVNAHACLHFLDNNEEIIKYLIFDCNIDQDFARDSIGLELGDTVIKMFKLRELNKELSLQLKENNQIQKKIKI